MRMRVEQQEAMYSIYWKPLQDRLGSNLTECIRHFLMKDGVVVKQGDVFFTLKDRADRKPNLDVIAYLKELYEFAGYYERFLYPEREPNPTLGTRFERLNRIEVTTAYPFLLNVYHEFKIGNISEGQFAQVLDVLENYVLRRFICGVPTNALNKIFPVLYFQVKQYDDLVEGVESVLSTKNYPKDSEFQDKFVTARLYGGDRGTKGKLILERLESSFGHHETVNFSDVTIEHIMPQTLTDWWKGHLGGGWEEVHEGCLHTIGNLTLTGYNQQLFNYDYPTKLSILRTSHLELNKYFDQVADWNESSIRGRAEGLAERALKAWKYFGDSNDEVADPGDVNSVDQDEQHVTYDIAAVLKALGGGSIRPNQARLPLFNLSHGRVIHVKYSKLYTKWNYYWYGLRPDLIGDLALNGATHVVFVMGKIGMAAVPLAMLRDYVTQVGVSSNTDGSIRHHHIKISSEENPCLFWSQETPRFSLGEHFVGFE